LSHIAGITDVNHHIQIVCWDGVLLALLPGLAWKHSPPSLCLPSRWDYSVYHHA
jgi:hypothetical protein